MLEWVIRQGKTEAFVEELTAKNTHVDVVSGLIFFSLLNPKKFNVSNNKIIPSYEYDGILFRFYTDRSEATPCTKWSTLTINEMEKVYNSIDLTKVLDNEYDIRKTCIDHLHVAQLRKECNKHGIVLTSSSKKEYMVLKLQELLGEHSLVSLIKNSLFKFGLSKSHVITA